MFSCTQTSAGCALRAAQLQRLKDQRRDVEVAGLAAVGDLLHLHEALARGAPGRVGLRLLLRACGRNRARAAGTDAGPAASRGRGLGRRSTKGDRRSEQCARQWRSSCRRSYTDPAARRGARVRARQPFAQQMRRLGRRAAVERHQRGRHAGQPDDVGAPAVLRNARHLDQVRAPCDGLFEAMNVGGHDNKKSMRKWLGAAIVCACAGETSEAPYEGACTMPERAKSFEHRRRKKISLSIAPQEIHHSSTGFAQAGPLTAADRHTTLGTSCTGEG